MTNYVGTVGDDNFTGSAGYDNFDLSQGGNDQAKGGNSSDSFTLGGALNAQDKINGGAGFDYLYLNGDYSAGLTMNANTVTNIEYWYLYSGHSYNLTVTDTNNSTGTSLAASALGATDVLTFNATAETANGWYVTGGAADDVVNTGGGADYFYMQYGGNDTVNLGSGADGFYAYDGLTHADRLDGGDGYDSLNLSGNYAGGVTFDADTIHNIEGISLSSGNSYSLTFNNANVAAGQTLQIYGGGLADTETVTINGSAETDGSFFMYGGAGKDKLTGGKSDDTFYGGAGIDKISGGAGDDYISGGAGHDTLTGGNGGDIFAFADGDSPITNPDIISDLSDTDDLIDLSSIDADTTTVNDQSFNLVGSFTGHAGQLTRSYDAGSNLTSFLMDTNGDSVADIVILANGNHTAFNDFFL